MITYFWRNVVDKNQALPLWFWSVKSMVCLICFTALHILDLTPAAKVGGCTRRSGKLKDGTHTSKWHAAPMLLLMIRWLPNVFKCPKKGDLKLSVSEILTAAQPTTDNSELYSS